MHPDEIEQFSTIRGDKENNHFNAVPGPKTSLLGLSRLLDKEEQRRHKRCHLGVVLKSEQPGHPHDDDNRLLVKGGTLIGFIVLEPDHEGSDPLSGYGAKITVAIHHEFAKHWYGKEALIAVFDYILLSKDNLRHQHNAHMIDLRLTKVCLECKLKNVPFQELMRSLFLQRYIGKEVLHKVPSKTYIIRKEDWERERLHVKMNWRPEGHRTLDRKESSVKICSVEEAHRTSPGNPSSPARASDPAHASSPAHAFSTAHASGLGHSSAQRHPSGSGRK
jgi:hypothetical protein